MGGDGARLSTFSLAPEMRLVVQCTGVEGGWPMAMPLSLTKMFE